MRNVDNIQFNWNKHMYLKVLHFIISNISIMSIIQRFWTSIYNRYKTRNTITQEGFCILSQQGYDIYKMSNMAGLFGDRDNFLLHISRIRIWLSTLLVYNFPRIVASTDHRPIQTHTPVSLGSHSCSGLHSSSGLLHRML